MTAADRSRGEVRGVVLDIEGTTTPVTFVYDVLFPYARTNLHAYVADPANAEHLREPERLLRAEWSSDSAGEDEAFSMERYAESLMDRDSKSPGLKRLQGLIWEHGYRDGTLRGAVFDDVPPALERWCARGRSIAIYSSGSVLAQRLLFANSTHGDLTPLIDHYFDTGVGSKRSRDSYTRIAESMGRRSEDLLFISDVAEELAAANAAGLQILLCVRGGRTSAPATVSPVIRTFDEVD